MNSVLARIGVALLVLIGMAGGIARGQPLPTDPRLVTGELDNGLKYIVMRHNNPPNRAAVWLHIASGSLNETDKQRGIAHYLEHMAFNGSTNFPPGSVIPFFQSLGLTFGQHQNAFTSFDQTTYQLALPDNNPETLQKAMLFLSDVGLRLEMPGAEIENERQVILEERRTRLGGRQRVSDYWFENLAPGSIFGQRIPIGTEETIKGVQRGDFQDYYKRWYVPSNMTVMAVADMDPAVVVEAIRKNFSGGDKAPKPVAQNPGIKPYTAPRAIVASDAELTDAQVSVIWIGPAQEPTTTVQLVRRDLVDQIGAWCFNRRLQKKVAEGKVSFLGGGASTGDLFSVATLSQLSARGEATKWRPMLTELAAEAQRARLHGFSEQEVADARKEILAGAERAVETEATAPAQAILSSMNSAITDGIPITSAAQDLAVVKPTLPTITAEEVSARFAAIFDTSKPVTFSLQMPTGGDVPTEAQLVEAGTRALDVKPEAEAQAARATAFMDKLPAMAEISDLTTDPASGVVSGWLANNARVHFRRMDYRKDQVTVAISVVGGEIQETAANRGITQASALAWGRPATSKLSSTDIRDLMTGKKVQVRGNPGVDVMTLAVSGSPAELETGMQLAYLLLTDPVVEAAGFDQWQKAQKLSISQRKLDPRGVFMELVSETLYPADAVRVRPMTEEQVGALTAPAAQEWLRTILASGPIEVAIVGDIDQAAALDLARRYIGSLSARARISPGDLASLRGITPNTGPLAGRRELKTKTDQAIAMSGFYGVDAKNLTDVRLMNMAARILTTRAIDRIREKEQLAYSPTVSSTPGTEYPELGLVATVSSTAPDKVEALIKSIGEMYDDFAKSGPTAEELETAKKQMANTFDEQIREPGYWTSILATLDYRGRTLESVVQAPAAYQAFTADQIRGAFAKYHTPARTFRLDVTPEAGAKAGEPAAPAGGK